MKRILLFFLALCSVYQGLFPECDLCNLCDRFGVTIKNGYFYPQESVLRDIFDRDGSKGGYWFEGALRCRFWKELNLEASGSYFKHDGKALCGCECVEVKLPTFGLGLKYFFNFGDLCGCNGWAECVSFFLGGGLRVFFYREKDGSCFVRQCVKKTVPGGMVNAGFEFLICKRFFIDLFVDYNGAKVKPDCPKTCGIDCCPSCIYDLNIGGVVAGIGLGCTF